MEGDPKLTKENSKNAKKNKRNSVRWGVETRITLGLKSLQLIWIGQVFIIETQSESNSSQRKWDFSLKLQHLAEATLLTRSNSNEWDWATTSDPKNAQ